jgi:hypothetical protein
MVIILKMNRKFAVYIEGLKRKGNNTQKKVAEKNNNGENMKVSDNGISENLMNRLALVIHEQIHEDYGIFIAFSNLSIIQSKNFLV